MSAQVDLAVQLNCLRSTEEWTPKGQGLSFLFLKEGVGKCVSGFIRVADHIIQMFDKLSTQELLTRSVGELAVRFDCGRRPSRLFTAMKALNPLESEPLPARGRSFDPLPGDQPADSEMGLMSAAPASKRRRVAVGED